jgi:hypothetical protein
MKSRPWIWLIFLGLILLGGMIATVVIAVKHESPDIPVKAHGSY